MEHIVKSLTDCIGNTPLMEPVRFSKEEGLNARILLKLEYFNPLGSVKDRVAYAMVTDAENRGLLKPGSVIIEPTSGSTGIGLAFVGATRGYRVILTMPETMSAERRQLLAALGAEVVLTPGNLGMAGSIKKADELAEQIPNSFIPRQFDNPANPEAHRRTTALEILRDTDRHVDLFVAGVGTGGTLTGIGEVLKKEIPEVRVVAVEPAGSPLLSGGKPGPHNLQGIGANFIPSVLNTKIYDEVVRVENEEAYEAARKLVKAEGLLLGISSGAALFAAVKLAKRPENKGKTIVAVMPDTGERYLSTELYRQ